MWNMADKIIFGRIKIIPAKEEHIEYLAKNMRREDAAEVFATSGDTPRAALEKSFRSSKYRLCAFFKGVPLCMFGLTAQGFLSNRACLWLLGTAAVKECQKDFCRATRHFVKAFLQKYAILFNFVDTRYETAQRWLEFAGAEFKEAKPYGKYNMPFKYFEIRR
jgi:hypothetical protein